MILILRYELVIRDLAIFKITWRFQSANENF